MAERRAPRRILITGACGFVGRWLIAELRGRMPAGSTIIAGVHASDAVGADVSRRLDVRDREAVFELVGDAQPTAVVHLAAVSSPPAARSNPRVTWDINVIGTMNLADAVLARAPLARFIFIGSSECYGGSFNKVAGPVDEDVLLDPANPYATTKAAADLLIGQMARDGLRAVRFRPFNHTGPGQTDAFVVPAFAAQIAAIERGVQEPLLKVGNLDALRDFSDVRDIVSAYADAILRDEEIAPGSILNLASGRPLRIGPKHPYVLRTIPRECAPTTRRAPLATRRARARFWDGRRGSNLPRPFATCSTFIGRARRGRATNLKRRSIFPYRNI